ncbi:hypothetical protein [Shinella sp.]|uniref:hypothetical protein n=1 Tax=Shinella sp. TaxID=1870904 RepID=UPI0028A70474|nr:hypothetical protein [Shinella sp.]
MQDRTFDDSMPADLIRHYKPLAIRAVVAACSVRAERSESDRAGVMLAGAADIDDAPFRDEPAPVFIR